MIPKCSALSRIIYEQNLESQDLRTVCQSLQTIRVCIGVFYPILRIGIIGYSCSVKIKSLDLEAYTMALISRPAFSFLTFYDNTKCII